MSSQYHRCRETDGVILTVPIAVLKYVVIKFTFPQLELSLLFSLSYVSVGCPKTFRSSHSDPSFYYVNIIAVND